MAEFPMTGFSSNALAAVTSSNNSAGTFDVFSGGVFEPDVMLPSQLLSPDEEGLGGGERRLMAAILSDGIEAYITCNLSERASVRLRAEVSEWVEVKDENYVFSFDNVCICLGINPDYLRLGLGRYLQAVRTKRSEVGSHFQQSARSESVRSAWKKIRRPRKHH